MKEDHSVFPLCGFVFLYGYVSANVVENLFEDELFGGDLLLRFVLTSAVNESNSVNS